MGSLLRFALLALASLSSLACARASSSRDAELLGYGPVGRQLGNGYGDAQGSPFERPTPLAWPVSQQPSLWASAQIEAPVLLPTIPPSADVQQLCVHVVEFLVGESSEPLDLIALAEACQVQARTEKLARTAPEWQDLLACMLAANTDEAFDACEHDHPSRLELPTEHPRELEACEHLVMTTLFEEMGSDANLPASEIEQFRPVIEQCIAGLIADERPGRSESDYAALLACVLAQSSSTAMEACD